MTHHTKITLMALVASSCLVISPSLASAVSPLQVNDQQQQQQQMAALGGQQQLMAAHFDSPALRIISDEDQLLMQQIKHQIEEDFANFKAINEVHAFLDKVKLLVQKHPKNVAFAQGDLRDLHKFLSLEIVTRLIRVDAEPFNMPISDDKMPFAQRALEDDELTRKLFSGPLRSLIEAKKQHLSRSEDGNHRDGNFFSNFWCKISGSCPN